MAPIKIFCFSDILCIWAYIAQIRLDELQRNFSTQVAVQYHFVSVFGSAREKLEKGWQDRGGLAAYGQHIQKVSQKFNHINVNPGVWTQTVPTSSLSSHVFLKAIELVEQEQSPGSIVLLEKVIKACREAFFCQLRDISHRSVQLEIAEELNLPIAQIQEKIESGTAYARLSQDLDLVKAHAVTVSPTLIFNEGRQRLNGNVGYRVIEANIRELLNSPSGEASWC
ncbi:DsbA family oxidoreductase [Lyngbya confervoides]|uniref:DsbA family protein n=1 Tax=Lyngbya confervoides BDU141951 TaxID=1574623 RepID=A0ABD4T0T2_9CYAN|nr:DsbA family protein [Lyngbya confervoides]MCM1982233.1 DsbA family protein [Lyngbya confervoides BDU141951]